ncbi:hypothetical protein [Endozoicomonas sp. GU-1]|uniref:hypothetical protein n=1 Tax=Endozoicomonas sp. GU-1 TaxID=3009078 RepID=UPI0022B57359|nr:hypothetical protein [Endozoicomonas sp. GU-1]WBA81259.1 hypothetical protein O2T12_23705 [Endozoicomonas sp. GU-1]
MAANLETLLLPAPYLFIHGHKMDLPKAQVTFMPPPGQQTTGSALINALLNLSDSQPPKPENPVYSLLMSLPQSYKKRYPDRPPWTGRIFSIGLSNRPGQNACWTVAPGFCPAINAEPCMCCWPRRIAAIRRFTVSSRRKLPVIIRISPPTTAPTDPLCSTG